MTDTIREQILTKIAERIATIRRLNGYNTDIGTDIFRGFRIPLSDKFFPASSIMPGIEEGVSFASDVQKSAFQVEIQGIDEFKKYDQLASERSELIYADLIECIFGHQGSLGFDSGGAFEITPADVLTGVTSGAEAFVETLTVSSGDWVTADAAGTFTLRRVKGEFADDETLDVDTNNNVATVDGTLSWTSRLTLTTDDLAESIEYVRATPLLPEGDQLLTGMSIIFNLLYKVAIGNPFSQTIN